MEFDLKYSYQANSVEHLVRLVRVLGDAEGWQGQSQIGEAVVGVLADPEIADLRSKRALDNYIVVATTSWILEVINQDEYFAGSVRLANLLGKSASLETWGIPTDDAAQLLARLTVIVRKNVRHEPHIASLAGYLGWMYVGDPGLQHEFFQAVAAGREWFAKQAPAPWIPSTDVVPAEPRAAVAWLRRTAIGPRPPAIYEKIFDACAVDRPIIYLYVEFGYPALWQHPQSAALERLCEESLSGPARMDSDGTLTPEEDEFIGRILADRLCKMFAPRAWGKVRWGFVVPEALGPIAYMVTRRAYSDQTRHIARGLLTLMRIFNEAGVLPIAGLQIKKFSRVLYSRIWPAMAILGGITGLVSLVMPWWLTHAIGTVGLYFAYRMVRFGRLISKYTLTRYPRQESIIAAGVIGGTYWAAITGVGLAVTYPQHPATDFILLPPSLAAYIIVIGCIIRFPGTVEVGVSDLLPDVLGVPDDVMESIHEGVDNAFEGRYRPQRLRQRRNKASRRDR